METYIPIWHNMDPTIQYQSISISSRRTNDLNIIILRYQSKHSMNQDLDSISNEIDGHITGRLGHNIPIESIPSNHRLHQWTIESTRYIVAYCAGDRTTLQHELLHARYHLDTSYRDHILQLWSDIPTKKKSYIIQLLQHMGYKESVWIDEWQAYHFSEHLFT